jgi:translation initiation factor 2 alpha subunit (eIF-2alpha)
MYLQQAMKKAEAAGNDNCPVKIKLVAPPLYVLTTQTLDKVGIILVLNNMCEQFVIAELFDKVSYVLRPILLKFVITILHQT